MNKLLISLTIFAIFLISGCSNEVPKEFDLDQLIRVDFEIYTDQNETIITEEEKIETLREVFAKGEWEQNIKAEMARKEDVKATLFFTFDRNMPERLFDYLIWFNQDDATATIIDSGKNALGTLDKEGAKKLQGILVND